MSSEAIIHRRTEMFEQIDPRTQPIVDGYIAGDIEFEAAVHDFSKICVGILCNVSVERIERPDKNDDKALEARMICFYILQKVCYMSVRRIGRLYHISQSSPYRDIKKMDAYIKTGTYKNVQTVTENTMRLITHRIKSHYSINKQPHG